MMKEKRKKEERKTFFGIRGAEKSFSVLIGAVIGMIALIVVLMFTGVIKLNQTVDKTACHTSVVERATLPAGREAIPLNCRTEYVCLSKDGSCEDMTNPQIVRVNSIDETYNVLAEKMADCWWMFGEGNVNYVGQDWFNSKLYCSLCDQVVFDNSLKELFGGIEPSTLDKYNTYASIFEKYAQLNLPTKKFTISESNFKALLVAIANQNNWGGSTRQSGWLMGINVGQEKYKSADVQIQNVSKILKGAIERTDSKYEPCNKLDRIESRVLDLRCILSILKTGKQDTEGPLGFILPNTEGNKFADETLRLWETWKDYFNKQEPTGETASDFLMSKEDFYDYLSKTTMPDRDTTYLEYLTGFKDMQQFESALSSNNYYFGYIDLTKPQFIMMGIISEVSQWTSTIEGIGLGLIAATITIFTGGAAIAPIGLIAIGGGIGYGTNKLFGVVFQGGSGKPYIFPTIVEASSEEYGKLKCADVKTLA